MRKDELIDVLKSMELPQDNRIIHKEDLDKERIKQKQELRFGEEKWELTQEP